MLKKVLAVLLSLVVAIIAAPPAATRTYDQRQDGDLNVKVDLDNFVILVARPVSSLDLFGAMAGLLAATDNRHSDVQATAESPDQPVASADSGGGSNDNSSSQLAIKDDKEEPRSVDSKQESEKKTEGGSKQKVEEKVGSRGLEEVVRTLRSIKEKELRDKEKPAEGRSFGKYKFVGSVEEPHTLKLIGDSVENCGPGRNRDSKGICQGDGRSKE